MPPNVEVRRLMSDEENAAAADPTREYVGDGVSVLWFAERCIHSGNCARSLRQVFDPRRRPWIEPRAATADAIVATIERCPSGALQYRRHEERR